jgi:hypothetical protein
MINEQFCLDKFKSDAGYLLFDVPRECRTYAVCLEAVKRDWHNFSLVPYELRTPELCLAALNGKGKKYGMLPYIPEKMSDPEVWLAAVKNGLELWDVPEKLLTEEMCIAGMPYEGKVLWWDSDFRHNMRIIPKRLRTKAVWLEAIKFYVYRMEDLPKNLEPINFFWRRYIIMERF